MVLRIIRGLVSVLWSIIKLALFLAIMAKIVSYVMGRGDDDEQEVPIE